MYLLQKYAKKEHVNNASIRKLARRGGCKRISRDVYDEMRGVLEIYLKDIIRSATIYATHAKRNTVTAMDIVCALKRNGQTVYGFGG